MRTNGWVLVAGFALVVVVSAAVVSTSALTAVTLSRETTVSVTADDAALVTLVDGHPGGGFVAQTSGSTLEIDLTRGGGSGANANATVELGSAADPIGNHAFYLEHRGDAPANVSFEYSLDGSTGAGEASGPQSLVFTFSLDAGDDGTVDSSASVSENTGSTTATIVGVQPGDPVYATVVINTSGLSQASDLSGNLGVTVTEGT